MCLPSLLIHSLDGEDDEFSLSDTLSDPSGTPEETFFRREETIDLQTQLMQLPELEQFALSLAYLQGYTIHETAVRLGYSDSAVYRILARGKKRLRDAFASNEEALPKKPIEGLVNTGIAPVHYSKSTPVAPDLASAVAQLRDPYRSVLTLAILKGYKYSQIAALRHCPLGTIKVQVSRGMRLLRAGQQSISPVTRAGTRCCLRTSTLE